MKYIETKSNDPHFNLAFEDYVLTNRTDDDYLMLWQNDNSIIIGRNQNTYAEINADAVKKYGVHVARRATGGGAVYHDLGNLNYSFITREDDSEKIAFEKFVRPIVDVLKSLGLPAETSGRNDIMIDGCKVSGVAQRYKNGRVLHHGTLLFDEDLDMANEVLHVDPDKIKAKGVKSVRSRIGNIRELLELHAGDAKENGANADTRELITIKDFWDYIKSQLVSEGMVEDSLTAQELSEVRKLCDEQYATWEWNYGKSLEADISQKAHFPQGWVEAKIKLDHGLIADIKFYGDFMNPKDLTEYEDRLRGHEYNKEEIEDLLEEIVE